MGVKYSYKCKNCDFSVVTSAGHDCGMLAVTDTYVCTSCNELVDVSVGVYGQTYSKEEIFKKGLEKEFGFGFYECPECNSGENLIPWDRNKKPCPICGGKMKKDKDGIEILWD